jgi:ATP-dependent exoDNAse (exonuclease V), alpha subunit - helicase superfamily I member
VAGFISTTPNIDRQIYTIDKTICRHIAALDTSARGIVSQDILSQLRNFTEHIMLKFYTNGVDIDNSYENICKAIDFIAVHGNLKLLRRFHDFLQIVASHYTLDEENSERLMLKYYEYLLKIKKLMNDRFGMIILQNLSDFPISSDETLAEYYEKIAEKIMLYTNHTADRSEKYYIQKIKPFFVRQGIFYEVTFTPANDYSSKFDRIIAFTSLEISDYYSVKFSLANDSIEILGKTMPITIIVGWEVAIRDCEYKNFSSILNGSPVKTTLSEQQGICAFLRQTGYNLVELVCAPMEMFESVKKQATQKAKSVIFLNDLERCRKIIQSKQSGANLLRYLLYHMNNIVIKDQWCGVQNANMSNLFVANGSIPFDKMPFISSPLKHNPRLGDLFDCIPSTNRKQEILARLVRNNTEIKGQLFTSISELTGFDNIPDLAREYNSNLWPGHRNEGELVIQNGQIFINGYKNDTCFILQKLREYASGGVQNYSRSIMAWLNSPNTGVDSEEKKIALIHMFESSRVALIYGSAGTGKSTLINHVAHFFADKKKLFLSQTNPAVDNLKRRVSASNCTFMTIAKFVKRSYVDTEYDLLIIDECSTVSNRNMRDIINKASFKLLLLVGDTYQIASIRFGNWFSAAQTFISGGSVFELTKPYRSDDKGLLSLWERVRKMDDTILEVIARQNYSVTLDASIFSPAEQDEIILCLNYDGLYGINNINRFLQESNPNPPIGWGIQQYKIGDPVLFNDNDRFGSVIYNNTKGTIVGIKILSPGTTMRQIQFDIKLDKVLNGMDAFGRDFELLHNPDEGSSVIRFCVNVAKSTDDDENSSRAVVPFQVAYAVSIHKAQGLEYSSVKIVITDEVDELITHNIFYTAITRAQKKIKIYWTPEVEQKVLTSIVPRNISKDVQLLRQYL